MRNRFAVAVGLLAAAALLPSAGLAEGTIKGTVHFKGKAPKTSGPKIDMSADANCAAMHTEPVYQEFIVVNDNGTLRDVFVYVKSGLPKQQWPMPGPALIDQKGCTYVPHVLGVMAGQTITIRNSDATSHNIHALPKANPEFNFGQPQKGMTRDEVFKTPEMQIKVKCDVHPWMGAWVFVMDNPFFAVTGTDGAFEIKGLPAGEYVLEAWQEKLGTQEIKVKVDEGSVAQAEFTFERGAKKEE